MLDSFITLLAAEAGAITTANPGFSGTTVVQGGVTMGSALAIVCSWQRNRSILWAIVAGFLTWFYVIYFAVTRKDDEKR